MIRIAILTALLAVTGCSQSPWVETSPPVEIPAGLPAPLVAHVMTMDKSEQPSILGALVVLVRAHMIGEWVWTPPTEGSAVAYYQVATMADVPTPSIYVLRSGKVNITVTARGFDDEGNSGEWSAASDTTQAVTR